MKFLHFPIACIGLLASHAAVSQNVEYVKTIIDSLCAPAYHGRGYVDQGDVKAAKFIERQLDEIGTEQPVEMLESLRAMPNMNVVRAADANEMAAAYQIALKSAHTPTVICCTRGTVPALEYSSRDKAMKGGYIVLPEEGEGNPDLVLVATGSEVWRCVDAAKALQSEGIRTRVVSLPCQEVFLEQSEEYRRSVLPGNVPTLSVEASSEHGWHRWSHAQISMTRFGMSGPLEELFVKFGFDSENVASKGKQLVEFYKNLGGNVPDLNARPSFVNIKS